MFVGLAFSMINCVGKDVDCCEEETDEVGKTLRGTKWKLVGIVDVEEGGLEVWDPEECNASMHNTSGEFYTLEFGLNKIADGYWPCDGNSAKIGFSCNYTIDYSLSTIDLYRTSFYTVSSNDPCDWKYKWSLDRAQTFELDGDELKLYYSQVWDYNEQGHVIWNHERAKAKYLLFERRDTADITQENNPLRGGWRNADTTDYIVRVVFTRINVLAQTFPHHYPGMEAEGRTWYDNSYSILPNSKICVTGITGTTGLINPLWTPGGKHVMDYFFINDTLVIKHFGPTVSGEPYPLNLSDIYLIK
jgi:hypothetical protein